MFDLKAKIVVNQYQIPYLIEKELTDLEKDRIIEMAGKTEPHSTITCSLV
jgi:hypothetical protein